MSDAPFIAVFTKNRTNPAYAAARLGADRTAQRMGARTVHYVPQKPDDADEQIALIDTALAARPAACVLVPVHPTAVNAAIRKINAAGVPIVGFINRFTEPKSIVSLVTSEDYPLALAIATYLCGNLKGRGDVVIVEGPRESVTSLERVRGFRDAVKKFPAMRVAATVCGEYQHDETVRAGKEFMKSQPRFDAVLAANDVMALAMLEVFDAAGRASVVVGINAVPDAITAIKRGKLLATVDFDAMKMGCLATEAAIRHLRGEKVPAEIILPVQVVDTNNCALWDKSFEERGCPRWEDIVQ
ncbi:MAG: sugar ABC transporter substrate-binding protein [Burkholderiales bacterium]